MKIEQLEQLCDTINNKEIVKLLMDKSNSMIDSVIKMSKVLSDYRTKEEQIILIKKYISYQSGKGCYFYSIITNINILKNRTFEEQLKLINKYKNSISKVNNENDFINIICDSNILKNRTFEEQLKLINIYIKNDISFGLIVNKKIIANRTNEEQLKLINLYINNSAYNLFNVITNSWLLKERNFEEQLKLIDKILSVSEDIQFKLVQIVINNELILHRTNEEQLKLIDVYLDKLNNENDVSKLIVSYNIVNNRNINQQIELINKYIEICKKSRNNDIDNFIISGKEVLVNRTFREQLKLINIYLESDMSNEVYDVIIKTMYLSFSDQLKEIEKITNQIIPISSKINEFEDMKLLLEFLKQNEVKEFNSKTKVQTYKK